MNRQSNSVTDGTKKDMVFKIGGMNYLQRNKNRNVHSKVTINDKLAM